jgi:hypothetical protein
VTVFVTNDGLSYSAGFGGTDGTNEGTPPQHAGDGVTFTYFGSQRFRDSPQFHPSASPSDGAVAVAGGGERNPRPNSIGFDTFARLSTAFHSYSDVYSDRGENPKP